jgi:DNA-binding beta-propeller fold protein YncE
MPRLKRRRAMKLRRIEMTGLSACLLFISLFPGGARAGGVSLTPLGTYPEVTDPEVFGAGAAETVAYDASAQVLMITNRATGMLDVVGIADPTAPLLVTSLDMTPYGGTLTDVAIFDGTAAVTVPAENKTDNGVVLLFDVESALVGNFDPSELYVGPSPDALAFSKDGKTVVCANEGEPTDDYTADPEGSVSIIDVAALTVRFASFTRYNNQADRLRRMGVRIFGPGATVAEDLEPENVTVSQDSKEAWVSLQENNAFAVVDIRHARIKRIVPAGYKFHLADVNSLDASDKDKAVTMRTWPIFGMYEPDGIASFTALGRTFYIAANEGDARSWAGFSEEARVKDLPLSPVFEQYWPGIQEDANLGRLKTTTAPPFGKVTDASGNEMYTAIFSYGGRSFTIWSDLGIPVYDSQNIIESRLAETAPDYFNTSNDENKFDGRSDDKGAEPEAVTVGEAYGMQLAFVALERQSGVMTFDVTNPYAPRFLDYADHRDYNGDPEDGTAGDLGPEDVVFIPSADSPNGLPLIAVPNEISGTTTVYQIDETP